MEGITEIDVIILSCAHSEELRYITTTCLKSLHSSEDPRRIKFNIVVVESEKRIAPYQFDNTTTIYPEGKFSWNRYWNIGVAMTYSKFICLCSNGLIFHHGWATEMLTSFNKYYDLSSASPVCSVHHPRMGFQLNSGDYCGYRNSYEVAGWCLFLKRDVFRITGKLDENYKYWCADNDYSNMLSVSKLKHALVSSSIVDHIEKSLFDCYLHNDQEKITADEFFYYEKKWNSRLSQYHWIELSPNADKI